MLQQCLEKRFHISKQKTLLLWRFRQPVPLIGCPSCSVYRNVLYYSSAPPPNPKQTAVCFKFKHNHTPLTGTAWGHVNVSRARKTQFSAAAGNLNWKQTREKDIRPPTSNRKGPILNQTSFSLCAAIIRWPGGWPSIGVWCRTAAPDLKPKSGRISKNIQPLRGWRVKRFCSRLPLFTWQPGAF